MYTKAIIVNTIEKHATQTISKLKYDVILCIYHRSCNLLLLFNQEPLSSVLCLLKNVCPYFLFKPVFSPKPMSPLLVSSLCWLYISTLEKSTLSLEHILPLFLSPHISLYKFHSIKTNLLHAHTHTHKLFSITEQGKSSGKIR